MISPRQPFVLKQSTRYLERFPPTRGDQKIVDARLIKAWRLGDATVASEISQQSSGRLTVRLVADAPITQQLRADACDRVSSFLSVSDDISGFYRIAEADPKMSRILKGGHGFHQVKMATPGEHLCWLILAQGKPLAVTRRMRCAIENHFGNEVVAWGEALVAFPSLAQLLSLDESDLRLLTGNARKSGYLFRSIRRLATVDDDFLQRAPFEEVQKFLSDLPGIGPLAALFLLERGLGRLDEVRGHAEALRDVSRAYGRPITEAEFVQLARRYGPWARYWVLYLRAFADRSESAR